MPNKVVETPFDRAFIFPARKLHKKSDDQRQKR